MGKVLRQGRIQNSSNKCLSTASDDAGGQTNDGIGVVQSYACDTNQQSQMWAFYENGEILN